MLCLLGLPKTGLCTGKFTQSIRWYCKFFILYSVTACGALGLMQFYVFRNLVPLLGFHNNNLELMPLDTVLVGGSYQLELANSLNRETDHFYRTIGARICTGHCKSICQDFTLGFVCIRHQDGCLLISGFMPIYMCMETSDCSGNSYSLFICDRRCRHLYSQGTQNCSSFCTYFSSLGLPMMMAGQEFCDFVTGMSFWLGMWFQCIFLCWCFMAAMLDTCSAVGFSIQPGAVSTFANETSLCIH